MAVEIHLVTDTSEIDATSGTPDGWLYAKPSAPFQYFDGTQNLQVPDRFTPYGVTAGKIDNASGTPADTIIIIPNTGLSQAPAATYYELNFDLSLGLKYSLFLRFPESLRVDEHGVIEMGDIDPDAAIMGGLVSTVADQAARLLLADDVGQRTYQTDTDLIYEQVASPATDNGNWVDVTVRWSDVIINPSAAGVPSGSLDEHELAGNPHSQYVLRSEAVVIATIGTVSDGLGAFVRTDPATGLLHPSFVAASLSERRSAYLSADLDLNSPEQILFRVGTPSAVVSLDLFIKGAQFSRFHYTEQPSHDHADTFAAAAEAAHTHGAGSLRAEVDNSGHNHTLTGGVTSAGALIIYAGGVALSADVVGHTQVALFDAAGGGSDGQINLPAHGHPDTFAITSGQGGHIHDNLTGATGAGSSHTHTITGAVTARGPTGSTVSVNTGAAHSYHDNLRIYVDGADRTAAILATLAGPPAKIGDGTAGDDYVTAGYDIDLFALGNIWNGGAGSALSSGVHTIQFQVAAGGGKIRAALDVNG